MKFATTFAPMMIAGVLPLVSASLPAGAKVFDWSLTGPRSRPWRGSLPRQRHDRCVADSKHGRLVDRRHNRGHQWQRDYRNEHFQGAGNLVFTNGFAFTSTVGISFETAAGQRINTFKL